MSGTVTGPGRPTLVEIDGYRVNVDTPGHMLVARNVDRPGMIGRVGTLLGEAGINIAFMQVGRKKVGSHAVMVLGVDDPISPPVMERLARVEDLWDHAAGDLVARRTCLPHSSYVCRAPAEVGEEKVESAVRRIRFFDTTLRDGEQSPGVNLNADEKLEIARQLARLGVDVIEAGFPVASPGDLESVRRIAREVRGPVIAALARANRLDIEKAAEAIEPAERGRIHTFIATSDIHMRHKLRKTPDEVVEMAVDAVSYAKRFVDDVEFSAEDATRSDWDFLCRIFAAAIEAGATTINIPDTVGYTTPGEYADLIRYVRANTPGIDNVVISVHCHDDLGMAVANSLAAIEAGADQVEGCINGIGERAGNAALEEIVMALRTRKDFYQVETGIVTEEIYRTSRLVSTLAGMQIQPNKAIVGDNAFAHESGIHQDGFLKEPTTYEIMTPAVGGPQPQPPSAGQAFGPPRVSGAAGRVGLPPGRGKDSTHVPALHRAGRPQESK